MQAFEGIRVLDMTHVLAGPFSTYQLAVLGADVIKIEPVGNPDMNRDVGAVDSLNDAGMGTHFQSQGANKRAMSLNLKSGKGREIFKALARDADVIVENFRAGALERLGLGYADLCAVKPDIIYCSITGFGQTGPKRGHGAFDNVIQAWSGMMTATGHPDQPPVMVGPPVADYGTGAQAAFAIASALLRRERTGEGQRIDVSMLDSALAMMACWVLNASLTGEPPSRSANGRTFVAAYGCYEASDTRLMIGAATGRQNARLWRALGREDLAQEVEGLRIQELQASAARWTVLPCTGDRRRWVSTPRRSWRISATVPRTFQRSSARVWSRTRAAVESPGHARRGRRRHGGTPSTGDRSPRCR